MHVLYVSSVVEIGLTATLEILWDRTPLWNKTRDVILVENGKYCMHNLTSHACKLENNISFVNYMLLNLKQVEQYNTAVMVCWELFS